jgi:hypothetical protein
VIALPRLRQPDPTTCGAASVIAAALLRDRAYAGVLDTPDPQQAFTRAVLDLHPRLRRVWPRRYGATPWAVARAMREVTGTPHTVRWVPGRRGRRTAWEVLAAAVAAGDPVPVFTGTPFVPRHVVLAHTARGTRVGAYEPTSGRTVTTTHDQFLAGPLPWGWQRPWALVLPATEQRGRSLSRGDSDLPG